jgi:Cu(I)/Ag(I) efflux system membrane fusion protein
VSNKIIENWAKATVSFTDYPTKEVEATISFMEINLDSRLLLIRMEIANPNLLKPGMQAVTKLTQSNRKVYLFQ